MIWGLFPILLANKGFELEQIAQIVAIYPMVWGIAQLGTGKLADMLPKKPLLFWGMLLQGLAIIFMVFASNFNIFVLLSVILGLGTAIVYPTFLAAIADETHPEQRPKSIGVFRLWRDLGYAIGALITGIIADLWDTNYSVLSIAFITLLSSFVIQVRMKKQMQR